MFWNSAITGNPYLETWEDEPGGTVVDRFTKDGVRYVLVEFKQSPGQTYLYLAK